MKFEFWEKCLFWKQAINKSKINPDYIIWLYLNYHYSAESHAERVCQRNNLKFNIDFNRYFLTSRNGNIKPSHYELIFG